MQFLCLNGYIKKDGLDTELLVEKLMNACAKYDMDGFGTMMAETYKHKSDDGFARWLRENVSLTDFTQIYEKLLNLTEYETI